MNIININGQNFENILHENEIIFVEFWAEWCAPCKEFAKIFEKVAEKNPDITFAKINIAEEEELCDTFHIKSIPHIMVFKEQIVIYSESGTLPESTLNELIEQAKQADVSTIRATLEEK